MSGTGAAWLARLRLAYPHWSVQRGEEGGFRAVRGKDGHQLTARTPGGLEVALFEAEHPPDGRIAGWVKRRGK